MTVVVAAIIEHAGNILVCQRKSTNLAHPLKWEFPGGKVEAGESLEQALARELCEELLIDAQIGAEMARYQYSYPGKQPIELVFFQIVGFAGTIENRIFEQVEWSSLSNLSSYDFLEGDIEFVRYVTSRGLEPTSRKPASG